MTLGEPFSEEGDLSSGEPSSVPVFWRFTGVFVSLSVAEVLPWGLGERRRFDGVLLADMVVQSASEYNDVDEGRDYLTWN